MVPEPTLKDNGSSSCQVTVSCSVATAVASTMKRIFFCIFKETITKPPRCIVKGAASRHRCWPVCLSASKVVVLGHPIFSISLTGDLDVALALAERYQHVGLHMCGLVVLYWHGMYVCALVGSVPSDAHHFDTVLQPIDPIIQSGRAARAASHCLCSALTGLLNRDTVYLELEPVRRSLGFTVCVATVEKGTIPSLLVCADGISVVKRKHTGKLVQLEITMRCKRFVSASHKLASSSSPPESP